MKTEFGAQHGVYGIAVLLLVLSVSAVQAQNFVIDWFTVDGGGGKSTGGVFSVTGTIGQPDAGRMSGGDFALAGGFWDIVGAVQTPGAPRLSVTRTNGGVILSWPASAIGFTLEQTSQLLSPPQTTSWVVVPESECLTNGSSVFFTIASPVGRHWFRLSKPIR